MINLKVWKVLKNLKGVYGPLIVAESKVDPLVVIWCIPKDYVITDKPEMLKNPINSDNKLYEYGINLFKE